MFAEAPKRAVWRDTGEVGGNQGDAGSEALDAERRSSSYIESKHSKSSARELWDRALRRRLR